MKINKDELKESLTIEQVFEYVNFLGGEPIMMNGFFISRTICHNPAHEGSHKLYYYENSHLFKCFTECNDVFDIFGLVSKIKKCDLPQAMREVAIYFGYSNISEDFEVISTEDWNYFKIKEKINKPQYSNLKIYDENILKFFPQPHIIPWENEGISWQVMKNKGICYDPINFGVVIPHYDINGNLIGIRERTLIKDNEIYGKYRPAFIQGKLYNHPLGFNLYNLNNSKNNIKTIKKAIVFEGEKSSLLYASLFGEDNDISVACCGSSLISYQVHLLLSLDVKEIIIAFDKQFQQKNDLEFKKWVKKLKEINKKYSPYVTISFMFDKEDLLSYKASPIDEGKEKFLELFKKRIIL